MSYRIVQLELTKPFECLRLAPGETGVAFVARLEDRLVGFRMIDLRGRTELTPEEVATFADQFAQAALVARIEAETEPQPLVPLPSLTIAICTKDRAARLSRLLSSLDAIRSGSAFRETEILVVDNASVDDATRKAVESFAGMRYIFEPKPGLNFARNLAVKTARGEFLAFLDDDVVVDPRYLDGLAAAVRGAPDAGGFTGLVLPYALDTEARIAFEARGGFGRGFRRQVFHASSKAYPLHPSGAGLLGAGCNMAFDRRLVERLGGFDDALDTGRPLPGGGDLDMFYRVVRSGRPMVYEPRYAVYHEHRETLDQLRHQYWTWGLGMMAFLVKSMRQDPDNRPQLQALARWWVLDTAGAVVRAALGGHWRDARFRLAELLGGVPGYYGEYDRSQRRIAAIRSAHP